MDKEDDETAAVDEEGDVTTEAALDKQDDETTGNVLDKEDDEIVALDREDDDTTDDAMDKEDDETAAAEEDGETSDEQDSDKDSDDAHDIDDDDTGGKEKLEVPFSTRTMPRVLLARYALRASLSSRTGNLGSGCRTATGRFRMCLAYCNARIPTHETTANDVAKCGFMIHDGGITHTNTPRISHVRNRMDMHFLK